MLICHKNFYHAQKLPKQTHNKDTKPRSYAPGDKVWFNIKTKQNEKLEAKFFGPFRVLHPVSKQAYKLELSKKWRIHDVFYISLLEQNTTRKGRIDENATQLEFKANDNKEYKVKSI